MMASGSIAPVKHGGLYSMKSSANEELMDAIVQRLSVVMKIGGIVGQGEKNSDIFVSDSKNYLFYFTGKS